MAKQRLSDFASTGLARVWIILCASLCDALGAASGIPLSAEVDSETKWTVLRPSEVIGNSR